MPRPSAGAVQGPPSGQEPSEADNERLLDAVVPIKQRFKQARRSAAADGSANRRPGRPFGAIRLPGLEP
jgi:hypothetical protein